MDSVIKNMLSGLKDRFKRKPKAESPKLPPRADRITRAVLWSADKVLLFACLGGITAVYILDGLFFASVGGELWVLFILVGLVLRSFVVGGGVVLQGIRGRPGTFIAGLTLRSLQIFCAAGIVLAPINFFAASHFQKAYEAESIGASATASTGSKEARIARLEKRRTDAAANRDVAIAASKSTAEIIKDQVVGTSSADNETLRLAADNAAQAVTNFTTTDAEISDQIEAIEKEREDVVTTAAGQEALSFHTWPVFIWLGGQFPVTDIDPATGLHKPGSDIIYANWILLYLALLIEVCVFFALGAYTQLHGYFRAMLDGLKREAPAATITVKTVPAAEVFDIEDLNDEPAETSPVNDPDAARREHLARIGKKGRESQEHQRAGEQTPFRVPLDDWRERSRMNGAGQ
jgi:hypothetical protein